VIVAWSMTVPSSATAVRVIVVARISTPVKWWRRAVAFEGGTSVQVARRL